MTPHPTHALLISSSPQPVTCPTTILPAHKHTQVEILQAENEKLRKALASVGRHNIGPNTSISDVSDLAARALAMVSPRHPGCLTSDAHSRARAMCTLQ